jgi:hypothetical protein
LTIRTADGLAGLLGCVFDYLLALGTSGSHRFAP